jgi:hypothetical protein
LFSTYASTRVHAAPAAANRSSPRDNAA